MSSRTAFLHPVETQVRRQDTATVPAQTVVGNSEGLLIAANAVRQSFSIQNTGTTVIKLALGTTAVTQDIYHFALMACTVANDGKGGTYLDDAWKGPVRAIGSAPGGTCVVLET